MIGTVWCLALVGCVILGATAAEKPPLATHKMSLTRGVRPPYMEGREGMVEGETSFTEMSTQMRSQMTNYRNTQYTGTVYAGSPPQPFSVILDTGSANFWVYSDQCGSPACQNHNRFATSLSPTFKTNHTTFFVKYGSGRINGILCEDNIQLGTLVIPHQIFGAVTKETGSAFMWGKYDGILGLAYPSLAIEGSQPVLDTIIQQGLISPMFSFYFSSGKTDSTFYVGGVPPAYAHHHYNWHHVIRKGYWEVGLDDVVIDGISLGACPRHNTDRGRQEQKRQSSDSATAGFRRTADTTVTQYPVEMEYLDLGHGARNALAPEAGLAENVQLGASPLAKFPENDAAYSADSRCKAAMDTGTSLITGPSHAISKLQALMGQVTNCDDLSNMPTVTLVLDGIDYPMAPEDYVLQFPPEDGQPASCLLGFKALDVPPPRGPLWVIGDVFMRTYFTVFDREQNRVGLTRADASPNLPEDPTPLSVDSETLPVGIDTDAAIEHVAEVNAAVAAGAAITSIDTFTVRAVDDNKLVQEGEHEEAGDEDFWD